MSKRGGKAGLSDEDRELWAHVVRSVAPLDNVRADPLEPAERPRDPVERPVTAALPAKPRTIEVQADPPRLGRAPAAPRHVRPPPEPTAGIDRRKQRQIASGRIGIDARIDLHGMTQDEAHSVLRAFLYGCAARGDRLVLVITGKGVERPATDDHFDLYADRRDRGVLRRNVPRWLAEPDLRPVVIGYTAASARHGGDGALYVQVRSRSRGGASDD